MWEEGPAGLGIWHHVLQRYLVGWVHESLEVPLLDEALLPAVMSPLLINPWVSHRLPHPEPGRPSLMSPKHSF